MKPAAITLVAACLGLACAGAPQRAEISGEWEAMRYSMVADQIQTRGVKDTAVLEAMRRVPRHLLVPEQVRPHAYEDRPLPIGHRQTISQPFIVASMTEAAKIKSGDKVLEVGTGSGYQAAVLAAMGAEVWSVEIVEALALRAKRDLDRLGFDVEVRAGDGYRGWPQAAPFDAVLVTAAPDHIPQPLIDQLKVGGRLVIPVGKHHQELKVVRKGKDGLLEETLYPVRFVPMTGEAQEKE